MLRRARERRTDHFCQQLQEADAPLQVRFKSLIGVGDASSTGGTLEGEVCSLLQLISRKVPFGETWFVESTYHAMSKDEVPWDEVGIIRLADEGLSETCYRLVTLEQCFIPSALRNAIQKDHHVVVDKDFQSDLNFKKNRHVILSGFDYGPELNRLVSRIPASIPSNQLWLRAESLSMKDRKHWNSQNRNLLIATEDAFLTAMLAVNQTGGELSLSPDATMAFNDGNISETSLSLIGLALPITPLAQIIAGYSFDLLFDGSWGFSDDPQMRIEVNNEGQQITAFVEGCIFNSRPMEVRKSYNLGKGAIFKTPALQTYRYLSGVGGPYFGVVLGPSIKSIPLKVGDKIELGRQPAFPGFPLPDRGGAERISWMRGPAAERASNSGLTLDRALTGRHQAAVTLIAPFRFSVSPMHDKLPTYLLKSDQGKLVKLRNETTLLKEGVVIVGTHIVRMS